MYASLFNLLKKILDEVYYCQTKRVGDKYKFCAVMLTNLFRQKRFLCEVTSTSTEKLSSPCQNQWFDTVSINLGT